MCADSSNKTKIRKKRKEKREKKKKIIHYFYLFFIGGGERLVNGKTPSKIIALQGDIFAHHIQGHADSPTESAEGPIQ